MERRAYLGACSAVVGTIAGCTAVAEETALAYTDDIDSTSAVLRFTEDGDVVFSVQIQKQYRSERALEHYPFRISTWQRAGARLTSLRLQFRSPPHSPRYTPAGISLQDEGHAGRAKLQTDRNDPSTTNLVVDDLDGIGRGSVSLSILLSRDESRDPQELWSAVEARLTHDGLLKGDYRADGETTLEVS